MTFEGFDAAPLIESGGFSPDLAAMAEPDAATLDSALREAARAERAATRAEALVLDLWVRPGGGFRLLDLPAPAATSAHAWAVLLDEEPAATPVSGSAKDLPMRAALGEGEEEDEEIVVKGTKPKTLDDDSDWAAFWSGGEGEGEGNMGGGGGPSDTDMNDPPDVTIEVLNEANRAQVEQAKVELEKEIERLTPLIEALPDDARITLKDGTVITGAELKALWARIDYVVTDRDFGADRAGRVVGNVSYINASQALGWDAHTNGLAFIMLHESVHISPEGLAYYTMLWQQHLASGGTEATWNSSSLHFAWVERYANYGARAITQALGIPGMTATPTHGY